MKTYSELIDEVSGIIQDTSYTDAVIGAYLNKGYVDVAGKVFLPELVTIGTVATTVSQYYSSLPAAFHRNLHFCYSTTNNRHIKIYRNMALLFREFSKIDAAGNVVGVAAEGNYLYYQRIPSSAETLQVHYYALPTAMSADGDYPSSLPDHLADDLLINFACRSIYQQIEDGIEGQKVNTMFHDQQYKEALADLVSLIGPDALNVHRVPQEFGDEMHLDWWLM